MRHVRGSRCAHSSSPYCSCRPPSTPLVLYCHSGRRSGIAVAALEEKGFTRLYDLQAYQRWVDSEPRGK